MKILVLGQGLVGAGITRHLLASGRRVDALHARGWNIDYLIGQIRFLAPDMIVWAGGPSSTVVTAHLDFQTAVLHHVVFPTRLASYSAETKCKLLYISSALVYEGHDTSLGVSVASETTEPQPRSDYSLLKLLGERALRPAGENALALRCGTIYDPECPAPYPSVLERMIECVRTSTMFTMISDANLSFISVENLARVTACFSEKWPKHSVVNACQLNITVAGLAEYMTQVHGLHIARPSDEPLARLRPRIDNLLLLDLVRGWGMEPSFAEDIRKMVQR